MKEKKKHRRPVPKVQITGDLRDVKKLVDVVSKKKTVVIFRNCDNGTCYADIEKTMVEYTKTDLSRLEKEYRIVFFDFSPGNKAAKPAPEKKPATVRSKIIVKKPVKKALSAKVKSKPKPPVQKKSAVKS